MFNNNKRSKWYIYLTHENVRLCVCVCVCVCARAYSLVSNSLWPRDHSPPGSSVHGIFQARIQSRLPGCQVLRGNLPIQESNPSVLCLLHCRWILGPLSHLWMFTNIKKNWKVKKQLGNISAWSDRVSHCLLELFEMLTVFSSLTPHK